MAVVVNLLRRRIHDPLIDTGLSFVVPFLAYLAAEEIHASGVISVVVAGLLIGHKAPVVQTSGSRITERVTWSTVAFLLEHAVFLLIGMQVVSIITGLDGTVPWSRVVLACAGVLAAVILTRMAWVPVSYTHLRAHET